jgi:hypothetical protein
MPAFTSSLFARPIKATPTYYARAGIDIDRELAPFLARVPEIYGPEFDPLSLRDLNHDLSPKEEFRRD